MSFDDELLFLLSVLAMSLLPFRFHCRFSRLTKKKKAPTKKQIAEEAVAAAVAQMGDGEKGSAGADDAMMASLDPKKRKSNRVRIDPLMPRGGVAPNEWAEMENLEDGCRGILVSSCHMCVLYNSCSIKFECVCARLYEKCVVQCSDDIEKQAVSEAVSVLGPIVGKDLAT